MKWVFLVVIRYVVRYEGLISEVSEMGSFVEFDRVGFEVENWLIFNGFLSWCVDEIAITNVIKSRFINSF